MITGPGPGRPKGSKNRINVMMKKWIDDHGDDWVNAVWDLAMNADKQSDRLTALTLLGKKVLPDLKSVEVSGEIDTQPEKEIDLSKLSKEELHVIQKVLSEKK